MRIKADSGAEPTGMVGLQATSPRPFRKRSVFRDTQAEGVCGTGTATAGRERVVACGLTVGGSSDGAAV